MYYVFVFYFVFYFLENILKTIYIYSNKCPVFKHFMCHMYSKFVAYSLYILGLLLKESTINQWNLAFYSTDIWKRSSVFIQHQPFILKCKWFHYSLFIANVHCLTFKNYYLTILWLTFELITLKERKKKRNLFL